MARRRKNHAEHVGGDERWAISYMDFITLLFIVFIILYSYSQVDLKKYEQVASSLNSQFSGGGNPVMDYAGLGDKGQGNTMLINSEELALDNLKEDINEYAREKGIITNINMRSDERGLYISITGTVLYEDASATLTPQAKEFINSIITHLKSLRNHIRIEGHTDDRPIRSNDFPSNWELSAARATNLVRYLIEEHNFDPHRLSLAAYGEYRPISPNNSPENRSKNRRVEIIILKTTNTNLE